MTINSWPRTLWVLKDFDSYEDNYWIDALTFSTAKEYGGKGRAVVEKGESDGR